MLTFDDRLSDLMLDAEICPDQIRLPMNRMTPISDIRDQNHWTATTGWGGFSAAASQRSFVTSDHTAIRLLHEHSRLPEGWERFRQPLVSEPA